MPHHQKSCHGYTKSYNIRRFKVNKNAADDDDDNNNANAAPWYYKQQRTCQSD
jgi:hypothetical protein